MELFEHSFFQAATGGILIGLASWLVLLAFGRVTGISGIATGAVSAVTGDTPKRLALLDWRVGFLIGLVGGGVVVANMLNITSGLADRSPVLLLVAGLLVGYGTVRGSGCTSGHGVCGLGRRSARSLVAVAAFMAAGMLTVTVTGLIAGVGA